MKSLLRSAMYTSNNQNRKIISSKKCLVFAALFTTGISSLFAQNKFPVSGAVGIGTTAPNASSLLDIVSTNKGLLIPRMTILQRNAIVSPAVGLLVYATDRAGGFYYFNGTLWVAIAGTGSAGANTSLSNLIPTAINQSLVPLNNNGIELGTSSIRWNNLYSQSGDFAGDVNIAGNIYKGTERVLAFTNSNTSVGEKAMPSLTAYFNTAVGFGALNVNVKGGYNTASGGSTLASHRKGDNNTAIGFAALQNDTSGTSNTAVGRGTMMLNANGAYNTAIGDAALFSNSTGTNNTATGTSALYSNKTGFENTADGSLALASNLSGKGNVAVGSNAMYNSNTDYTVAIGDYALSALTSGVQNVAVGSKAGNQTKGSSNSYFGYQAGVYDNASNNTAIGYFAGCKVASGDECTFIGSDAGPITAGLYNAISIGSESTPTASNQARIGNYFTQSIGGQVGWTSLSDGRFKKNIKENVPGLAFINLLKPVTYTFDLASIKKFTGNDEKGSGMKASTETAAQEKIIHTGFVAQEVEAIAKRMNYDFDGVDAPKNDKDAYGIRYAEFVVPLVKAVQELSKKNNELEERLARLEAASSSKTTTSSIAQSSVKSINNSAAFLEQNTPNPSGNTTNIRYTLPQQYSKAQIIVSDNEGRMIQTLPLISSKGSVQVDVAKLSAGFYRYSLLVDNTMVASKQMIVAK